MNQIKDIHIVCLCFGVCAHVLRAPKYSAMLRIHPMYNISSEWNNMYKFALIFIC